MNTYNKSQKTNITKSSVNNTSYLKGENSQSSLDKRKMGIMVLDDVPWGPTFVNFIRPKMI